MQVKFLRNQAYHAAGDVIEVSEGCAFRMVREKKAELVPNKDGSLPTLTNPNRMTKLPDAKRETMVPQQRGERMKRR